MTLHDAMDEENVVNSRSLRTMGHLLMLSIKQAIRRGGLHCGITCCSQLLKSNAASVMFCALPANCDDLSMQIHHTLIKAFCLERNIPAISINKEDDLALLIEKVAIKGGRYRVKGNIEDMKCVLIQYPAKGVSKYDKELIQQYSNFIANGIPVPTVEVPT